MYLFFDTETTGLPKQYWASLDDLDNWPRLVQLAWLLVNEDGVEQASKNRIIKPEGFVIPAEASAVHGISTEKAMKEGIELSQALEEFIEALAKTKNLVAHNISFDEKVMGAEFLRNDLKPTFFDLPRICTMHGATDYCAIETDRGYKWPRLVELHKKLFGEEFDGAHDALADVKATARCFFELKERGVL
jgi:DNA polymerase-3 subunit epsilon